MVQRKKKAEDNNKPRTTRNEGVRRNKTYRASEHRLRKATCKSVSKRRFSVKTCELYREAKISKPTFYQHYSDCADVRDVLEKELLLQFKEALSCNYEKRRFFSILMEFVVKNKLYFCAAQKGSDHYLLTKILLDNRDRLVSKNISDRVYCLYARWVQSLIDNWLEFEDITLDTAAKCAKQLESIRPTRYW